MPSVVRCLVVALAALGLTAFGPTGSAAAHPFGDPQTAEISVIGVDRVRVHWKVGMVDDLTYLAMYLGLLPDDRVMLDGAVFFDDSDPALLQRSPAFEDYLLEQITVTADAARCAGVVADKSDVLNDGATLEFTCSEPVTEVDVRVSMLTDLNPAYKTLASSPDGQKAVYDGNLTSHSWTLATMAGETEGSDLGRSAAVQMSLVGLGVLALAGAVAGLVWFRRRSRRKPAEATASTGSKTRKSAVPPGQRG
ncbi:hypothetical protein [Microtetraspora sp. NBRC 16547]|uniref:hypothetical protein n=1 Tax=Microtetraspora sp. NBRC 16547 TaxID=3030993 RepID=UPI0024A1CF9D|nr:hypothetical protein [Microtetraspora sp. NBRC 16547]GLX02966.1 hypothetical protein Misp02_70520 [Microtetraspora sp. NBRC 16547]